MEARAWVSSVGLPLGAAVLGSIATASGTRSLWYERLEKPAYQPPPIVFPVAWTVLYTHTAIASGIAQAHLDEEGAASYRGKFLLNMTLNAGWSWTFFRARHLGGSVAVAGALAASSIDLAITAGRASRPAGGFLAPYAAWTTFATVLTAAIWRRNRRR